MPRLWKIGLILVTITCQVYALPEFIGQVESWKRQDQKLILDCSNGSVVLTVLTGDLIRVQLAPDHQLNPVPSFAVIKETWPSVAFDVSETENELVLRTGTVRLDIRKNPCRLSFYNAKGELINADDSEFGMAWDGDRVQCWKQIMEEERYYGLGEKVGNLNKWQGSWTMWNTDFPGYGYRKDPLYQSHPFFMGLHHGMAYGIFFDNTFKTNFQFGVGTRRFYTFQSEGGNLDYYFINGPTLKDVLSRYSEIVGRMPMPPKWALGYQQCRYSYYPESEVRTLANNFRDKQFPCDVIYLDIHYMDGYRCFTWDRSRFPDPKRLCSDLEKMGFKMIVIIDPGIKVDPGYPVYNSGLQGDHFCKYPDGSLYVGEVWPGDCHFPDFIQSETRTWWGDLYKGLLDDGVDGFWNDMNEPAAWGGGWPELVEHHDGNRTLSHREAHNVYGMEMARGTYEGNLRLRPDKRPFVLTRAGYSGVQRYAAVWTGDNIANWQNVEMSVSMCLGMSLSGIPFVGYDIGGFNDDPSPEMFTRWLEYGIYTPLCRNHTAWGTNDQEPWVFGDDHEVMNREILMERYALIPYIYDAFRRSTITGLPVQRPMVLEYPDDPATHWMSDQFLFGEDLLIAPVVKPEARLRKVYLPEGTWFDRKTNQFYKGPAWVNADAPMEYIPVFAKGGAVIPMQPAENYIGERKNPPLILDLYPVVGSFEDSLYEDAGDGWDFKTGGYAMTHFYLSSHSDSLAFRMDERKGGFKIPQRELLIRWNGIENKPQQILINRLSISEGNGTSKSKESVWEYDAQQKQIRVYAADDGREQRIEIIL